MALAGVGLMVILVVLGISWLMNSCVLWIVLNLILHITDGAPFKKCILAVLLMTLAALVSALALFIPILGIFLFLFAWYKLSVAVLEGIFEMTTGAGTAFVIYLLVNLGINYGVKNLM